MKLMHSGTVKFTRKNIRVSLRLLGLSVMLQLASCTSTALDTSLLEEPGTPDPENTIAARAQEVFHAPDDLVLGNPSGKITIVEFFDYNCIYCKANVPQISKLIEADQEIRVVIKEYPILGQGSLVAARAAVAAAKQGKYREFHLQLSRLRGRANMYSVLKVAEQVGLDVDALKHDMGDPAIDRLLEKNKTLAEALPVTGTPTFIIDDSMESRFLSYDALRQKIASIRDSGGCRLC